MVRKQNGTNGASTRRTYLHAAGAALGVAALASGTAVAGDADTDDARELKKTDEEFGDVRPLRLIDEPGTYKLTEDLHIGDDSNTGILITVDDVVLKGNGNTIAGDGTGILATRELPGVGETVIGGIVANVNIKNIVFKDLNIGVSLEQTVGIRVRDIVVKNSGTGFLADDDSFAPVLRDSRFEASHVESSAQDTILLSNTLTGADEAGLLLDTAPGHTVIDNDISDNDGPGISATLVDNTQFLLNEITDNGGAGIELDGSDENRITLNTITDNGGAGVELKNSDDNLVRENDLSDNADGPCTVDDESTDNTFLDNDPACEA